MNHDDELDLLLSATAHVDESDGDVFTAAVMTGFTRARRRRRVTLGVAGCATVALVAAAWMFVPVPTLAPSPVRLGNIIASLALATLCSWVWIAPGSTALR